MQGESTHGDEFAEWYGALWPRVLRAVTVTVGNRDLAEEATAEAFARALARWPGTERAEYVRHSDPDRQDGPRTGDDIPTSYDLRGQPVSLSAEDAVAADDARLLAAWQYEPKPLDYYR